MTRPRVTNDFETRSRLSIKQYGRDRYARDPSTSVLSFAYAIDDGPVVLWLPGDPPPDIPSDAILVAHNSEFEISIWNEVCTKRYGWAPTTVEDWECTAARSAHYGIPRDLDGATKAILEKQYWKDPRGEELLQQLSVPNKKTGEFNNDPELLRQLYEYNIQDVVAERELDRRLPKMSDMEQWVWRANCRVNERGLPIDRAFCEGAHRVVLSAGVDLGAELEALTDDGVDNPKESMRASTPKQGKKILHFLNTLGVNIDNLRADTVNEILKEATLPEEARKVLEIRQAGSSAAVGKLPTILRLANEDDRVRGSFMYYGADRTGRFSSVGVQLQNMKGLKEGTYPDYLREALTYGDPELVRALHHAPIDLVGKTVRWAIKAPDGSKFVLSDLAQIEARVLHWLANDQAMLDKFRNKHDPYKALATVIYNTTLERVTDDQRKVAKVVILGAGYGMGATRFVGYAAQFDIELTPVFAKQVIDVYREENALVTKLWRNMEHAALECIRTGRPFEGARLKFRMEDSTFTITLPSGRKLYYHQAAVKGEGRAQRFVYLSPRYGLRHEWAGGILTENVTQAIARDILVHGWRLAESEGLEVVVHVHDELGVLSPDEDAERDMETLERCMTVVPVWAPGLPLGGDSRIRQRFEK